MTNLEIIKYLATNNPTRLAELLDDIYCGAYNDGYVDDWDAKPNFKELLFEDASESSMPFYNHELEEWSKATQKPPCIIMSVQNGPTVRLDLNNDGQYMWNTNNDYEVLS